MSSSVDAALRLMIALDPVSEPLNRTPHKAAAFPSADRARLLTTLAEIRLQIVREAESGMALVENTKSSMSALSHTNFVWHVDMEKHVSNATFHVNRG